MNAYVVRPADAALRDLGGGVSRRVLAHTDDIMIVEVHFEAGSVGVPHTHPHAQATRVLSGEFVFTVDGKDVTVREGDTLAFPSNILHGTRCVKPGVLLDIFSPMRADFL